MTHKLKHFVIPFHPDNLVSQHIIKNLGFKLVGEQMDERDGLEQIYELSSENYLANFLGKSS